ncbi:serine/arginine repetitive matrix protein 1-like [Notolabrus celidotus]|uniref:serine/arginine repetitive matrix protein 1-like n=1 Tax=Notolabrus celidotus TaxID=1203425 RepID=UPI0014901E21|nr:serine/arginine repetitive matrix protein 1-like [Notolabrus celidotus]XP_034530188.1 serine/arginine repetitive matrix protein 1-like [Notolabrus celidotus]
MFSDSRATAPGEQKGFKPHAPHFIPWLRNSLKPHHSGDLGLNGQFKSSSEARNNLAPLEKAKGIGFFSIQGKDRAKKGELRCNGVGMARMLPVVLRGHNILQGGLGKQREESPARWNQPSELQPHPSPQISSEDAPQGLSKSSTRNQSRNPSLPQSQNDRTSTQVRKYGPLVGPPPAPATEETNCKVPLVVGLEDKSRKVWDYNSSTTYRHRDLHSSSWVSSDSRGLIERQHGFTTSFSYIKQQNRTSQSQRDLREPPVEGFNGPLNGVIFSTEVPQRGLGCTTTLRGPRKPRPGLEPISILGQNQTWVQYRPKNEGEPQRKEAGCSRKVVRNQIKRVVNNLEQVLTALRDVQQEMREVVHQIDYLTSSIDLNEEEQLNTEGGESAKPYSDSSSGSGSSSGEVMLGSTIQRPPQQEYQSGMSDSFGKLRRGHHHSRSQSPPNMLLGPSRTLRFTCSLGSSPRRGGHSLVSSNPPQLQNHPSNDLNVSPQRTLPIRPPTPGLSPLTVNLHHSSSPVSQPHSPVPLSSIRVSPPSPVSPKPHPPPINNPSVVIENKAGAQETPQSDHPSAQAPSASCPPTNSETQTHSNTNRERRASSAGPVQRPSEAKPLTAQGRRGRKPPPYPHHRLSDPTEKVKEPRQAPPYPEKRRLLSTTV